MLGTQQQSEWMFPILCTFIAHRILDLTHCVQMFVEPAVTSHKLFLLNFKAFLAFVLFGS